MSRLLRLMLTTNAIVVAGMAVWFLIGPALIVLHAVHDPGLIGRKVPRIAFRCHKALAGPYERWARARLASGRAAKVKTEDVAGTEWPLHGSVFYLWATEALEEAWKADASHAEPSPASTARGAIEALADLIADPDEARWVRDQWGPSYLERENLFYRMLLIAGLTSYEKLTGSHRHHALLATQVESLANELDRSPYGLLEDYPGQCYPIDVITAVAAIRRADAVLGSDHTGFVARARRGFEGARLDPQTELPAYEVDPRTGQAIGPSRGIGVAYMLIWGPELWSETAGDWYERLTRDYWQAGPLLVGYREFARNSDHPEWGFEVDAGPVIGGFGTASSAFGIGAGRAAGRFDHAYPLAAEAVAASWPLPDGTLLVPRLLSKAVDAPYLGESAMIFCLSRTPPGNAVAGTSASGRLPGMVLLVLLFWLVLGFLILVANRRTLRSWQSPGDRRSVPLLRLQAVLWLSLLAAAMGSLLVGQPAIALLSALVAQLLPRAGRAARSDPAEVERQGPGSSSSGSTVH